MKIILEYSEEQQAFHNNTVETGENTNGYKTLGEISEEWSFGFVQYVRRYFVHKILTFDDVKELFDNYINQTK